VLAPAALATPTKDNPVHAVWKRSYFLLQASALFFNLETLLLTSLLPVLFSHDVFVGCQLLRHEEHVKHDELQVQEE